MDYKKLSVEIYNELSLLTEKLCTEHNVADKNARILLEIINSQIADGLEIGFRKYDELRPTCSSNQGGFTAPLFLLCQLNYEGE